MRPIACDTHAGSALAPALGNNGGGPMRPVCGMPAASLTPL